jgi:hypothetical protein
MPAKKLWAKSTNGPDWTDVEMLMRSIGGVHSGHVGLTILPSGTGATGGLKTAAHISFDVLPGSRIPPEVMTTGAWPCNAHSDLAAHAFSLLHGLDYAISQVYENAKLWD